MSLELTDQRRYELEKENIENVLLAAARRGKELEEEDLARSLGIDRATTQRLIQKLQTDKIIK